MVIMKEGVLNNCDTLARRDIILNDTGRFKYLDVIVTYTSTFYTVHYTI